MGNFDEPWDSPDEIDAAFHDAATDYADFDDLDDDQATRPASLDPLQQQAISDAQSFNYTNISGTAGVGKTHVAKEIVRRVEGTVLAATTGIAAINLGEGTTINALLRYFNTESLVDSYRSGHLKSVIGKLRRTGTRRILIDEKSMLSGQQLNIIAKAIRELNEGGIYALEQVGVGAEYDDVDGYDPQYSKREEPPPMGITLVGDFGQLPPVPDEDPKTGKKIPIQFAFESAEWPIFAEHTTTLQKIYRQDAQEFVAALHAVRAGRIVDALKFFTPDRFSAYQDDGFEGSTIFAKNDAVDRHNLLMLERLAGAAMTYDTVRKGKQRGDWKQIPDRLSLKEGALVMILANRRVYEDDDDDRGRLIYANGDLGTLLSADSTGWSVRLQRTGGVVRVLPIIRENTIPLEPGRRKELAGLIADGRHPFAQDMSSAISEKGKGKSEVVGTVMYMPMRAAYGATVYKSQGLTLDRVQVNLRDPFFKTPNMLFVALSRCRTAEGLRIIGDQKGFVERIRVEPRTLPWL